MALTGLLAQCAAGTLGWLGWEESESESTCFHRLILSLLHLTSTLNTLSCPSFLTFSYYKQKVSCTIYVHVKTYFPLLPGLQSALQPRASAFPLFIGVLSID